MKPVLRDIVVFTIAFAASRLLLIGPLLSVMILTGAAAFVIPLLLVFLGTGLFVDVFGLRRSGTRGFPFTAAGLGVCAEVTFGAVTTAEYGP